MPRKDLKSPARLRYEADNPQFNIRIPVELLREMREFLAETGMNKPQFIREALRVLKEQGERPLPITSITQVYTHVTQTEARQALMNYHPRAGKEGDGL